MFKYSKKQLEDLDKIKNINLVYEIPLSELVREEMSELNISFAKCNMNEGDRDNLLTECVDVMNTLHNFINEIFTADEIDNRVNKQIGKAKKVLDIKEE